MTPTRTMPWTTKTFALIVAGLLAVAAIGVVAARGLVLERNQARAFVSLGRTALAKGDRASAILSFERARLLAPRADFVHSALADSGVPALEPSLAQTANSITSREWSSLAVAFGWMAGLSLAVAIVRTRGSRLARPLALGSAIAFVLSTGGVVESNLASRALAVVMGPTGSLVAPYEGAGATADLRAGTVVITGERYGDFVQVRGADGMGGWVPSGVLKTVVGAGA